MGKKQAIKLRSISVDGESYDYYLRRSKRAKNLILHVDIEHGIEVVVPWYVAYRAAEKFVWDKRSWIVEAVGKYEDLKKRLPDRKYESGEELPYLGNQIELKIEKSSSARSKVDLQKVAASKDILSVSLGPRSGVSEVIERWYRKQARSLFALYANELSSQLGEKVSSISIRNQKTQWGSCSSAGKLSFNWRLLLAPREVAIYVVVHEVAHLKYKNHSKEFWQCVSKLDPRQKEHRMWLRKKGYTLVL